MENTQFFVLMSNIWLMGSFISNNSTDKSLMIIVGVLWLIADTYEVYKDAKKILRKGSDKE